MTKSLIKYTLILFDRQINVWFLRGNNECISTRIGRMAWADNGSHYAPPNWHWWFGAARMIWYLLEHIDPGHCRRAYESGV
jgi:hypothetical protein